MQQLYKADSARVVMYYTAVLDALKSAIGDGRPFAVGTSSLGDRTTVSFSFETPDITLYVTDLELQEPLPAD